MIISRKTNSLQMELKRKDNLRLPIFFILIIPYKRTREIFCPGLYDKA